jgi:hypothetical protein
MGKTKGDLTVWWFQSSDGNRHWSYYCMNTFINTNCNLLFFNVQCPCHVISEPVLPILEVLGSCLWSEYKRRMKVWALPYFEGSDSCPPGDRERDKELLWGQLMKPIFHCRDCKDFSLYAKVYPKIYLKVSLNKRWHNLMCI